MLPINNYFSIGESKDRFGPILYASSVAFWKYLWIMVPPEMNRGEPSCGAGKNYYATFSFLPSFFLFGSAGTLWYVHLNGCAYPSFHCLMNALMHSSRFSTDSKSPRASNWRLIIPNQISTWLSHYRRSLFMGDFRERSHTVAWIILVTTPIKTHQPLPARCCSL